MKTRVNDDFPFSELECQYFDICNNYTPDKCAYTVPCERRRQLRQRLEPYASREGLKIQIDLILEDRDGRE